MKKTYKFTIPQDKEVLSNNVRIENGQVLVDVELKKKFQPKDGDFVITDMNGIYIYNSNYKTECGLNGFYAGISIAKGVSISNGRKGFAKAIRYATPKEKADFLARLEKECHKTWNAEKKCLEDVYVPKFGDIVRIEHPDCNIKYKRQHVISIFPNKEVPTKSVSGFFDIAAIDMNGNIRVGDESHSYYNHGFVKKASEAEKQELFSKLAEVGKRWNAETKQLEDIRWRAEKGEVFHYVSGSLEVLSLQDSRGRVSDGMYKVGNYFRTPEAAKKVADQIKDIFKNSKME